LKHNYIILAGTKTKAFNDECFLPAEKVRERRSLAFRPIHYYMLTNLWPTCPTSQEHNCDKHHKWKFDQFGTLDHNSEKPKDRKFSLVALY